MLQGPYLDAATQRDVFGAAGNSLWGWAGRANVIVLFHVAPDMSINISFSSTMKLPTVPWSRNQNIWQLSAASQTAMTSSAHLSLYLLDSFRFSAPKIIDQQILDLDKTTGRS